MASTRVDLSLGQRVFLEELQTMTQRKQELIGDARVAVKRNAAGDLVFAVVVPAVRLPQGSH